MSGLAEALCPQLDVIRQQRAADDALTALRAALTERGDRG